MNTTIYNCVFSIGLASALTLAAAGSSPAASVPANTIVVKAAASQQVTDVRWRKGWRHAGYRYGRNTCVIQGGYHRQMTC
jgi:hypothetical protein